MIVSLSLILIFGGLLLSMINFPSFKAGIIVTTGYYIIAVLLIVIAINFA